MNVTSDTRDREQQKCFDNTCTDRVLMLFSTAKSLLSGFDNKSLFLLKLDILFAVDQLARTL